MIHIYLLPFSSRVSCFKPLVQNFVSYIGSLGSTVRAISGVMTQIEWILGAADLKQFQEANKTLFQTQIDLFKERAEKEILIDNLSNELKKQLKKISDQQVEVFVNLSRQLQQPTSTTDEVKKELDTLLQLLSNGFRLLIRQIEYPMLKPVEMDFGAYNETPSGRNYKLYIQTPLAKLKEAFVVFVNNTAHVKESKSFTGPLNNFIKKCCEHSPFVIMGNLFYTTAIRKASDTNYFFAIYETFFAKDSKRMLNSFNLIMADLFQVLQLLQFCDEITDVQEFAFKYTGTAFEKYFGNNEIFVNLYFSCSQHRYCQSVRCCNKKYNTRIVSPSRRRFAYHGNRIKRI